LESRLKVILNYMAQPENNAILFIDEIHMIAGERGGQEVLSIANLLKPVLSRGEIQCIGATTQEEYRQHVEKDGALVRRFSNILVPEPSREDTLRILYGIRNYFEVYYELKIYDEALVAVVEFSQRYLTTTYLPDKAIDLLDETCGRIRSEMWYEPEKIERTRKRLRELEITLADVREEKQSEADIFSIQQEIKRKREQLEELLEQDQQESEVVQKLNMVKRELIQAEKELVVYEEREIDFAKAAERRNSIIPSLKKKIAELEAKATNNELRKHFVDQEDIALTVARKYGLSVERIMEDEQQKLFLLPLTLQRRIKGQDHALRVVSDAIFRARTGIQDPNRPLASFLFVGPTGVGKTEVALTVAEQLFDQKKNLLRLDMTEFSEPHSISKLIGSPPGYIGFEEQPRLEIVRERMNSVVLFDEIEKAHPEAINILLQILDNGFLTLANGREVNFRNTIIVLTTNLGSELYFENRERSKLEEELGFELKNHFHPEFLNRLDEIVFFNSLNEDIVREIINKELKLFIERVSREKMIKLDYNDQKTSHFFGKDSHLKEKENKSIVEKILQENRIHFQEYGVRPIKHYIEKKVGTLVARGIVSQFIQPGGNYRLELEEGTNEIKINRLRSLEQKKNLLKLKEKYE
jgi:ATP-dependent Clp protease ATP-binding subunit ClpB